MNMRKIQYILSGITLITLPLGTHAQQQPQDSTVNRTVVVEQEYNPVSYTHLTLPTILRV